MRDKRKIPSADKKLFVITGVAVALMIGLGVWRQWVNAVPDVDIPTPVMPEPNGYDFYIKAIAAKVPPNPPVDPVHASRDVPKSQWKDVYPTAAKEAWLQQNAKALSLLRQGFKHPCRLPPQRSALAVRISENAGLRSMARTLVVDSRANGERGDWKGAAESALDILELGHDLSRGGALIDGLLGIAINSLGRSALQETLPHLNAAESRLIARRLEKIAKDRVSYAEVLLGEKHVGQAILLEAMRTPEWHRISLTEATGLARLNEFMETATTPKRLVFNNHSNYMDAMIAAARKPYAADAPLPAVPDDFYNREIVPVPGDPRWIFARDEARNALALVSLALRAYYLEREHYPRTLKELVPHYLKEVPADPFGAGEPLRYKQEGAEYLLYCIGPDGVDNNGRAIEDTSVSIEKRRRFLVQQDSKGDMVAGINN